MRLPISEITVQDRHRRALGNVAALADSIGRLGLLHPIVVDEHNRLIAGERRLEAVKLLKWTDVPVTVAHNLSDVRRALEAECSENAQREPLRPSEMVSSARALRSLEVGNLPAGRLNDWLATAVGCSRRTLEKAIAIVEAAERDPSLFVLVTEMDATGHVDGVFQRLPKETHTIRFAFSDGHVDRGLHPEIMCARAWCVALRQEGSDLCAVHKRDATYTSEEVPILTARESAQQAQGQPTRIITPSMKLAREIGRLEDVLHHFSALDVKVNAAKLRRLREMIDGTLNTPSPSRRPSGSIRPWRTRKPTSVKRKSARRED